ncbi:cellulase family glycosylhydrolase [Sphingomonas sp. STIS6.2]|uniref:cellulase family glycosylhydrolase n=1 Tax=Sphingomonas sp. STIS6.2 TaxID=1379700 RepID=UPI000D144B02|nr:cellulase family glycosylhydrolase [Sphingomonas sp. STIS6.2]
MRDIMRRLLLIGLALVAVPATAQTEHIVTGASPPARISVCPGDTLVLKKQMGRDLLADGTRAAGWPVWNDRSRSNAAGNGFEIIGATKLRFVGNVQGKGWVYAPVDARPCATPAAPVAVAAPAAPARPAAPANHTARVDPLFGANLSGAEASGGDAIRPALDDWKGYIERYGFKLIRYPFKDDRMTPARIAELKVNVAYARSKGVPVILDNHTYRWDAPTKAIAFWTGFARNFPDDGSVILDLVNEPRGFDDPVLTNDWMQWIRDSKIIIAGLRANGIKHPIALEWPQWSATFRFDKKEGAWKACESAGCALDRDTNGPLDPLNRTYLNGHRYWDKGSSGSSQSCDITWGEGSGLDDFAAQLRRRGLKGIITEAAFGAHFGIKDNCKTIGKNAIADMKANADVLYGITWWGGGRVWPESYLFKIDGKKATRYTMPLNPYLMQLTGR